MFTLQNKLNGNMASGRLKNQFENFNFLKLVNLAVRPALALLNIVQSSLVGNVDVSSIGIDRSKAVLKDRLSLKLLMRLAPVVPLPPLLTAPVVGVVRAKVVVAVVAEVLPVWLVVAGVIGVRCRVAAERLGRMGSRVGREGPLGRENRLKMSHQFLKQKKLR